MARIILSCGGKVLREMALAKERVAIGRRPYNDIVIDHIAISGEHALIVTCGRDSFLEDLNSTNGTQVNGQPVKKHFLQAGDVIELAQYKILYVDDVDRIQTNGNDEHSNRSLTCAGQATIRVLSGLNAGKEIQLTKALTTVGQPDWQVAVIMKRDQRYYLSHVKGNEFPLVNGKYIGMGEYLLSHGDVIELTGAQVAFRYQLQVV